MKNPKEKAINLIVLFALLLYIICAIFTYYACIKSEEINSTASIFFTMMNGTIGGIIATILGVKVDTNSPSINKRKNIGKSNIVYHSNKEEDKTKEYVTYAYIGVYFLIGFITIIFAIIEIGECIDFLQKQALTFIGLVMAIVLAYFQREE